MIDHLPITERINLDEVLLNSIKNYHIVGFDYICLRRSPFITTKLYFFDGDISNLPEVVNPHDHRYNFQTWVVAGSVKNHWFTQTSSRLFGQEYQRFAWRTPLNGGSGFQWNGTTRLVKSKELTRQPGESYFMNYDEIHTIQLIEPGTILLLEQYESRLSREDATFTYSLEREPPNLSHLYQRFSYDEVVRRLKQVEALTNYRFYSMRNGLKSTVEV